MPSQPEELRNRTNQFAIRIVKMFRSLPGTEEAHVLGKAIGQFGFVAPKFDSPIGLENGIHPDAL